MSKIVASILLILLIGGCNDAEKDKLITSLQKSEPAADLLYSVGDLPFKWPDNVLSLVPFESLLIAKNRVKPFSQGKVWKLIYIADPGLEHAKSPNYFMRSISDTLRYAGLNEPLISYNLRFARSVTGKFFPDTEPSVTNYIYQSDSKDYIDLKLWINGLLKTFNKSHRNPVINVPIVLLVDNTNRIRSLFAFDSSDYNLAYSHAIDGNLRKRLSNYARPNRALTAQKFDIIRQVCALMTCSAIQSEEFYRAYMKAPIGFMSFSKIAPGVHEKAAQEIMKAFSKMGELQGDIIQNAPIMHDDYLKSMVTN